MQGVLRFSQEESVMSNALALTVPALPSATGSLENYIQAVSRFPILTQEEETRLARRFRDQEDVEAARQLVLSHLRVVVATARATWVMACPRRISSRKATSAS